MNCIKCGKEIPDEQVFCPECLADMSQYPVPHDAHVQILRRPAKPPEKKGKEVPLPEQINGLKAIIRRLLAAIGVLIVIIAALSLFLFHEINNNESNTPTGRNYTTSPRSFD